MLKTAVKYRFLAAALLISMSCFVSCPALVAEQQPRLETPKELKADRFDWVHETAVTLKKMPLDGKTGVIRAPAHVTVTEVSTIENGGRLILEGGTLEYKAGRLNVNDGTITILDGRADFSEAEPMMLCDDHGPSNINILGGIMTVHTIETYMAGRGGKITVGAGTLQIHNIEPNSSERDPAQWLWDEVLVPDTANGYTDVIITPWGNGGLQITAQTKPRTIHAPAGTGSMCEKDLNLQMGANSRYGDISGSRVVFAHGPECDFTWDIKCKDLRTEKRTFYRSGGENEGKHLDTQPSIDGDILVWAGGTVWRKAGGIWEHEPLNLGVLARNLAAGKQKTLRKHTMSESYSHPAVSGNIVVWLEHLNLDTTPLDSLQAGNWYHTVYNICGADITDLDNPQYFIVDANVGRRHPYPYWSQFSDFDDVVDVSGRMVVWEGDGDIYGADISNLKSIKVFPICLEAGRQFDPAISDNLVVWTDTRNDKADIYGADIAEPENIKIFPIAADAGVQHQPAIDDRTIVYVHKPSIFLSRVYQGADPAIDGSRIVWQTRCGEQTRAQGISLDLSDCPTDSSDPGK